MAFMAVFLLYCFISLPSFYLFSSSPAHQFSFDLPYLPLITWLKMDVRVNNRRQKIQTIISQLLVFFILYVSIPSTSRLYDSSGNYIFLSLSAAPERRTQTQRHSSWVNIASVFCCAFISVLSQSTFSNSWGWRPGMHGIASHKHAHNGLLSLLLSAAGAAKIHGRVQCISISKEAENVCENMNMRVCPGAV